MADLIDRDKLLKTIGKNPEWEGNLRAIQILQCILNEPTISAEPKQSSSSENPNKWISVNDRMPLLPDKDRCYTLVNVVIKSASGGKYSTSRFYDRVLKNGKRVERWKYLWNRISDENITHWMPLPEPPKEDAK